MSEITLEKIQTTTGVEYVYYRSKTNHFCISKNGKMFYKGFSMEGALRQLASLKKFLKEANQLKEGGDVSGTTNTINTR